MPRSRSRTKGTIASPEYVASDYPVCLETDFLGKNFHHSYNCICSDYDSIQSCGSTDLFFLLISL